MDEYLSTRETMKRLRCCVIIPTYNNAGTLEKIVRGVQQYTDDIIVVNDGCTDGTREILVNLNSGQVDKQSVGQVGAGSKPAPCSKPGLGSKPPPGVRSSDVQADSKSAVITLPANQGKGMALRKGFAYAIQHGYSYAITIDSDGQHFPEDIPKFIKKIQEEPDAVVVGARNMAQYDVPGTSSFGHRFSIFWFRVETGLRIPDVQSGFRLYPLERISNIRHFYSGRYEFEVEILVRLAWRGVSILPVPVKIWYGTAAERVSHFRKGMDFARTTLLNTILVFAALLWVRPFHFARVLQKKSFREIIRDYIINSEDSNAKISWSVVLGIFIGVSPFWGYQMIVAVSLAHFLRLNKFVSLVASNISIPPMIPIILFCSYMTGGFVLGTDTQQLHYTSGINFKWIEQNLIQYIVGSFTFGAVLAPVAGLTTYLLLALFRKRVRSGESERSNENR